MYNKVSTSMNFVEREHEILKFWKENDIFSKSIVGREDKPVFSFYDGPPTANGKPHIGHVLTRVIKDIIPRYKTMKGYKVLRKAGWDTHGLPVELEVEKLLGISGKPEIEEYGVEPFIKKCKESVWKYEQDWRKMTERVGYWVDMDEPYVTYHNNYIESVWWSLKQIWDQGLIYKGYKIVPYCPRCGTSLSSHEVAQGYQDVKEASIIVRFKAKDWKDTYFLAWTTTPWTLPSNVALTVNPTEIYVRAKTGSEFLIVAEALAEKVLTQGFEIVEKFVGQDLVNKEYVPLYNFVEPEKKAWFVCADNFVTLSDGTGIVHTAPAFGEDDASVGKKFDLPFVQLVNEQGLFVECVSPWAGVFVKDADPLIIEELTARGLVFQKLDYEHSYPFCWRCDTPLIYYARDTWFVEMTKVRDRLVKNNKTVSWLPETIGELRFGNFLENVVDWGLSRSRYWGTPLPIWECECGHKQMIGSIEELKAVGKNVPDDIELHKPYIDAVEIPCEHCGAEMTRVSDVIDCWYDSGAMPFAQWHYPFENKEVFEENFPADFISEAIDQTRGWFYTLLAISTCLFDKSPYKNVIVLGHVQDREGQKMSKHKGNVVDPFEVLEKQGADAVRWYFFTGSAPWLPSRFYEDAVGEGQRKFMGTFWNTYAFYILYAGLDGFNPSDYSLEYEKLAVMDKWVISKLHTLIKFVDTSLETYRITEAGRAISEFADELSNWYVRRCRERFWASEMHQDKVNAYMTLNYVLETLTKLSAPFVPFMAEAIYQNLVRSVKSDAPESVHLCDFPVANSEWILPELEKNMDLVLSVVVLGRAARNNASLKNRQPLAKMFVKSETRLPDDFSELVLEELNVKEIVFTDSAKEFMTYKFKPQLKTVGPKYGKIVGQIGQALQGLDGNVVMDNFEDGKNLEMQVGEVAVTLLMEDLLIEETQKPGYVAETQGEIVVVLDTNLSNELIEEGFVREVISKVQSMRKEAGFEVLDRITLYHSGNEKLATIISANSKLIAEEVLALEIVIGEGTGDCFNKDWNINGEALTLGVKKA
ncbi:MAG: isoleucine--tRNA ligase [Bacillota bacterium]